MNVFVFAETKQLACAALRFSFFLFLPFVFKGKGYGTQLLNN